MDRARRYLSDLKDNIEIPVPFPVLREVGAIQNLPGRQGRE